MFTLSHVKKSFGDNPVLRDVSIKVNDGDVVAVLGPSGSGKTTLLRAASYLTRADGGTVELDGEIFPLNKISHRDLLRYRRKTGFVFQNFNLFANKTVLQNVTAGLTIARKMPRDEAEAIAIDALKRVGMLDRKDYYPSKLSGGQQQRVAIARAMIHKPALILADEPTGNLDSRTSREIVALMRQSVNESGQTLVLITHDPQVAAQADRVIHIRDGRVEEREKSLSEQVAASGNSFNTDGDGWAQISVDSTRIYTPRATRPFPALSQAQGKEAR